VLIGGVASPNPAVPIFHHERRDTIPLPCTPGEGLNRAMDVSKATKIQCPTYRAKA